MMDTSRNNAKKRRLLIYATALVILKMVDVVKRILPRKYIAKQPRRNVDKARRMFAMDQVHGGGVAEIVDEQAAAIGGNVIQDVGVRLENEVDSTASSAPTNVARVNNGGKKRKRSRLEAVMKELSTMNENLKLLAAAIEDTSERVDMDQLMTTLMNIPNFDDRLIIECAEYLSADKKRVDLFFSMDEELRKKWLLIRLSGA